MVFIEVDNGPGRNGLYGSNEINVDVPRDPVLRLDSNEVRHDFARPFLLNCQAVRHLIATMPSRRAMLRNHSQCPSLVDWRIDDNRKEERIMPEKFVAENLEGGPGASHENRKQPEKSKPHGELKKFHPKQGNTKLTAQGKSGKGKAPWR